MSPAVMEWFMLLARFPATFVRAQGDSWIALQLEEAKKFRDHVEMMTLNPLFKFFLLAQVDEHIKLLQTPAIISGMKSNFER